MSECDICSILHNKDIFNFVYEDEHCFAILHESPSYPGHVLVIPKEHVPIIEELDDKIVEHLFKVCNKISTSIFETIGAHGTNILINNGLDAGQELAHLVINVIPRKEKDGISFEWTGKKISGDELKATQNRMKIFAEAIYSGKDKLPSLHVNEGHSGENMRTIKHDEKLNSRNTEANHSTKHDSSHGAHHENQSIGHGSLSHDSHGHEIKKPKEDYLTKNLIRMP